MFLAENGFNITNFCDKSADLLQYVGYALTIVKIAIPIIIIGLGVLDLARAVINSKEDETKKAATRLIWRLVAGIAIFLLPTIIMWVFETITSFNEATTGNGNDFDRCKNCILTPWDGCN